MKQLIVFDLDGTLAESKASLDTEMATLLGALLQVAKVSVISGGGWPQFEKQVLAKLPADIPLNRLSLLPACGTQFYEYSGDWKQLYAEDFTREEKAKIISALNAALKSSGFEPGQSWGERIEDRGSQITFSALGQQAPIDEKKKWDPDFKSGRRSKPSSTGGSRNLP